MNSLASIFRTCLLILLLSMMNQVFGQRLTVLNYSDQHPLSSVTVKVNDQFTAITDTSGIVNLTRQNGKLTISALGFITQWLNSPAKDSVIIMLPEAILIESIDIKPNTNILGYFGKWGNGVIQGEQTSNASVVNSIQIKETTTLNAFLFYIPQYPDSKINIPFEFVIYKSGTDKYPADPLFTPIIISNYTFKWNSFSFPDKIELQPGDYLFGMRWPQKGKDRQTVGTILKKDTAVTTYRSSKNGWKVIGSVSKDGAMTYSVALMGLIIE